MGFVERLHRWAGRAGERQAIEALGVAISYGELWQLGSNLAGELARRGAAPGDRLLVIATRSPELVVLLTAALRCGIAFSLIDPRAPDSYIAQCAAAVQPDFVVDLARRRPQMPAPRKAAIAVPSLAALANLPAAAGWETDLLGGDDLAAITFTSGTTRAPRAVAGRYGSLCHFFPWMDEQFGPLGDYRFGMCSGLAHDPLQRDIFTPLFLGATVCIPEPDITRPGYLPRWLAEQRIDTVCLTPPLLAFLSGREVALPDLKLVFFVGGSLTRADVKALGRAAPSARIVPTYGATESQRAVGYFEVPRDAAAVEALPATMPIGRGMKDVDLVVCRPEGGPCLPYEIGEIAIRSRFIALGYLDEPTATAVKFRTAVLGPADRVPAYMTGDYGYHSPEHGVVFVGRGDAQRKVDGHRVDLNQIVAACREHPLVGDAAAVLDEADPQPALVAFLVPNDRTVRFDGAAFADYLAERLPRYMVPKRIETLAALPLTLNGKIDDRALRQLAAAPRRPPDATDASLEIATAVAAFIACHTGIADPDPTRPLETLGIDSLRFLALLAELQAKFGPLPAMAPLHNKLPLAALLERLRPCTGIADRGRRDEAATLQPTARARLVARLGTPTRITETQIAFGHRRFDHFCSNSYLGLNGDLGLRRRLADFVLAAPSIGAHGSAEVNGHSAWHRSLIDKLAGLYGCDSVQLYGSCYLANISAIPALAGPGDQVFLDEACHRSLVEGALASGATLRIFAHNDPESLAHHLAAAPAAGRRLIVSEGVFSIEGDILALPAIAALARRHDCILYVDEACALGQLGAAGSGVEEHFGMAGAIDVRSGTLAKALAASGGYVACSGRLAGTLRGQRGAAFSTSLPPLQACLADAALDIFITEGPALVRRLQENATAWREGLRGAGFDIGGSSTAITTLRCADEAAMEELFADMLAQRLYGLPVDRRWSSRFLGVRTAVTAAHDAVIIRSALDRLILLRGRASVPLATSSAT